MVNSKIPTAYDFASEHQGNRTPRKSLTNLDKDIQQEDRRFN